MARRTSPQALRAKDLELWGGIEATVNRVGDTFGDQLRTSGHYFRPDDIDLIAQTGIKAIRYPILWEHHHATEIDWQWAEERLSLLKKLNIRPIVGLVHHGSGPRETSLTENSFVSGLENYARQLARRFPWVEYYTPINEPLTTARFSCLYGHWYPHLKHPLSFVRALFIETMATKAAMRAIREVNPSAKLVQTEDMGKTYSTELLAYQAEFENERRWLSLDLLAGRVDHKHPVYSYLRWIGVNDDELQPFAEDPLPPDIIGLNHYVTSERFLDENIEKYPQRTHGGNHRHAYADVSAVRVCAHRTEGTYGVLKEAWERYKIPVAITEAHLGCTREEQVRWLMEVWRGAKRLRKEGVDVRGVTVWSMLGAYDWDSLLTKQQGHYESGAFDLRAPKPRPTAIAKCMKQLATTGDFKHPIVASEGWWRRPIRFVYPPAKPFFKDDLETVVDRKHSWHPRPNRKLRQNILITGATGTLGAAFRRICDLRGLDCRVVTRQQMDIGDSDSIRAAIDEFKPWAIINTAGYVRVDDAENDADRCFRENTAGPVHLAQICADRRLPLLTFSSDLVFDGTKARPYVESDEVAPLNVYGRSKADAERRILRIHPNALVVRTSAFFGPWDDYNFITVTLRKLRHREVVVVPGDALVSPTYVPDLVHAALDLFLDDEHGIWHLANRGAMTWSQLARFAARVSNLPEELIVEKTVAELRFPAARPLYSVLESERGQIMGNLENALYRYFEDRANVVGTSTAEKNVGGKIHAELEQEQDAQPSRKQCAA